MSGAITDDDLRQYLPAPTARMTTAEALAGRDAARQAASAPTAAVAAEPVPTDEEMAARPEAGVIGTPESSARSRIEMGRRYAARDAAIFEASRAQTPPPSFYGGDRPEETSTRDALAQADAEDKAEAERQKRPWWQPPPFPSMRDETGRLSPNPLVPLGKIAGWVEQSDPTGGLFNPLAGLVKGVRKAGAAFGILPAMAEQAASGANPLQPLGEYAASLGEHAGEEAGRNFRERLTEGLPEVGIGKTSASGMADVIAGATELFGSFIGPGEVLSIFRAVPKMEGVARLAASLPKDSEALGGLRHAALAASEEARMKGSYAAFEDLAKESEKFQALAKGPGVEEARAEAAAVPTLRPLEPRPVSPDAAFPSGPLPPAASAAAARRPDLAPAEPDRVIPEYAFPPETKGARTPTTPGEPPFVPPVRGEPEPIHLPPSEVIFTPPPEPQRLLPRGPLITPPPKEPPPMFPQGPFTTPMPLRPGGAAFFPETETAAGPAAPEVERTPEDTAFFESLKPKGPMPPPAGPPSPAPAPGWRAPVGGFSSAQSRRFVSDLLDTVIAQNRDPTQAARAFYRTHAGDIVVKDPNDFGPIAHEAMHRVEDMLGGNAHGKLTGTPWARYADELDPIAHATYGTSDPAALAKAIGPSSSPTSEGAAEFMRHWLTDPERAKAVAPKFYDAFPGLLRAADPKLSAGLTRVQAEIAAQNAKTPLDRFMANVVAASRNPQPSDLSPGAQFVNATVDDLQRFRQTKLDVEARGGTLPAGSDPALAMEGLRNMVSGLSTHWAQHGVTDYWNPGRIVAPSLEAAQKAFPNPKAGTAYMLVQRILGAYDAREASIAAAIAKGEKAPEAMKLPRMDLLNVGRDASQEQLLAGYRRLATDTRPLAGEGPATFKAHNDAVVNYYSDSGMLSGDSAARWKDPAGGGIYIRMARVMDDDPGAGKGGIIASLLRRFRGESSAEISDPWQETRRAERAMVNAAQRNRVGLDLVEADRRAPGMASAGVRVLPGQFAEATVGGMAAKRAALEGLTVSEYAKSLGVDESALNEAVGSGIGPEKVAGGKYVHYFFNREGVSGRRPIPELARDVIAVEVSPEIHQTLENLPAEAGRGPIYKTLAWLADLKRAGMVHTPGFAFLSHLPADIEQNVVLSKTAKVPILANIAQAMRGMSSVFSEDEYYKALLATGGIRADVSSAAEGTKGLFSDALTGPRAPGPFAKAVHFVFQKMPEMGINAVRVGEARAWAERHGLSPETMTRDQAAEWANLARYASANPSVVGANMKMLARLSPFTNINIQGTRGTLLAFRDNPVKASVGFASLLGVEMAHWYATRNSQVEQDKTLEQRQRYWSVGDGQIARPKGFLGAALATVPHVMDHLTGRRPDAMTELARDYASVVEGMIPLLSNPAVTQFIEGVYGVRADQPLQRLIAGEAPTSVVPQRYAATGRYPDQGGIESSIGNLLHVAPIAVKRAVENFTGSVGETMLKGGDLLQGLFRPEGGVPAPSFAPQDWPIVGRVFPRQPGSRTAPEDWMYSAAANAAKRIETAKAEERQPDPADVALHNRLSRALATLKVLNQRMNAVRASKTMTPSRKRDAIDSLNENMATVARAQYR